MAFFSQTWLILLLAMLSGLLMAVQGTLNAGLGKVVGVIEATLIAHVTGSALLILILFVFRMGHGDLGACTAVPWYFWLGGLAGVCILYLVAFCIPQVGVANATTAIIVGQVLTAVIIDHFGGLGVQKMTAGWTQLAGLVFLAVGAKLLLRF